MAGNRTRQFSCLPTLLRFLKSNYTRNPELLYRPLKVFVLELNAKVNIEGVTTIYQIHLETLYIKPSVSNSKSQLGWKIGIKVYVGRKKKKKCLFNNYTCYTKRNERWVKLGHVFFIKILNHIGEERKMYWFNGDVCYFLYLCTRFL